LVSIVQPGPREPMVGDPDDHRPASTWRLIVDPGDEAGRVDSLALIEEEIAVGDRIPLHVHDVDELIAVHQGAGETRLGARRERVGPGSVVFIPAGVEHGTANIGGAPLLLHAVFPATSIVIDMRERNPAPGTDDDPPRRLRYDLRTGEFEVAD
jgi:quercetin dioxygenase-like cupin family protein